MSNLSESAVPADVPGKQDIHKFTSAAATGNIEIVEKFIKKWPQHINAKDDQTWTALMHAAWVGEERIVVTLLRHGADATEKDKFDRASRWFASRSGRPVLASLIQESIKKF